MTGLTLVVCRDYRSNTRYEYIISFGEEIVAREGFFRTYSQAKREGLRVGRLLAESASEAIEKGTE
jgi:hypothetical protein